MVEGERLASIQMEIMGCFSAPFLNKSISAATRVCYGRCLFGQGVSLLFSTYGKEQLLEKADVMKDFPVNNYIGAKPLERNLLFIPQNYNLKINPLKKEDREYIFDHIEEVLSEKHINKLWEMIWKRWSHFEQIRNKKNKWE